MFCSVSRREFCCDIPSVSSSQDVTCSWTLSPISCATPTATPTTSAAPCSTCSLRPTPRPSRSRSPGESLSHSGETMCVFWVWGQMLTVDDLCLCRVLLERLIVNRPHPWGLLITFIELIKNPAFKFWSHDFVHCAPEIEKYVSGTFDSFLCSKSREAGCLTSKLFTKSLCQEMPLVWSSVNFVQHPFLSSP